MTGTKASLKRLSRRKVTKAMFITAFSWKAVLQSLDSEDLLAKIRAVIIYGTEIFSWKLSSRS